MSFHIASIGSLAQNLTKKNMNGISNFMANGPVKQHDVSEIVSGNLIFLISYGNIVSLTKSHAKIDILNQSTFDISLSNGEN